MRIIDIKNFNKDSVNKEIKHYLNIARTVNVVKDLGVTPTKYDATTRAMNAKKIKDKILESFETFTGSIVFYFPEGEYHIDPIEIDANNDMLSTGSSKTINNLALSVNLLGETNNLDEFALRNYEHRVPVIKAYGNFIIRTNNNAVGNEWSNIAIIAQNLRIIQNDVSTINHDNAPHGICFGATYNSGGEHNFYIKRCIISGFDKGIYSPGYSCGGTRFEDTTFCLCKNAVLIRGTSHCLTMERTSVNACYRGITIMHGGEYCELKHLHVDSSFHPTFQTFLDEDPRCYFLYTQGGLTLDGVYVEQYTGSSSGYIETPDSYYLIDYEGNNYASKGGKLIVKNFPAQTPGGYGHFFRGATFQGEGTLKIDGVPINPTPLRQPSSHAGLWKKGCVDFINCGGGIDVIKKHMKIYEGIDNAAGYVFDRKNLYIKGVAFTKHPMRGFKGSYIAKQTPTFGYRNGMYKGSIVYEKKEIDPNVKSYKGTRIYKDINEPGVNFEQTGGYGCHLKGSVTLNKITNLNADFTIFLYLFPRNNSAINDKFIDLIDVNSSTLNKELTTNFEVDINALEYSQYSFGYRVNYDKSLSAEEDINADIALKMPKGEDETKIVYHYETEWDADDIYNYREVDSISLSSETLSINFADNTTETLTVTYNPSYTTQTGVDWTTSDDKVATVDKNGVITAVGGGECDIIATCNNNDYAHSATCKVTVTMPELQSISAVYTQGDTIVYPYTSMDSIKSNLVVTAHYAGGLSKIITDYSLSGDLTVGESTLTVSYNDKTTTFIVNVSDVTSSTYDYVTDNLLVYVQAEDGCVAQDETSTYIVDKYDGTHYSNGNLSTSMYDSSKKALSFTTSNSLKIDNSDKIVTVNGSYSMELMVRTESIVADKYKFIVSNVNDGNMGYGSGFYCTKNNVVGASYRPTHVNSESIPYTFNTDEKWIYLTLVIDEASNKFKYYVNGNFVNDIDVTNYPGSANPLSINTNADNLIYSAPDINAIRLYNKALTDSEIQSNYTYQQSLVQ